jgi:hypothetical protein
MKAKNKWETLFERTKALAMKTFFLEKFIGNSNPKTLYKSGYMNDHDGTIGYILWWLFDKIVMDIITTCNQVGDVIGHQ